MKPSILQRSFWQEMWDIVRNWLIGPTAQPAPIPIKVEDRRRK